MPATLAENVDQLQLVVGAVLQHAPKRCLRAELTSTQEFTMSQSSEGARRAELHSARVEGG